MVLAIIVQLWRGGDRRNLWPWVTVVVVDLIALLPGHNELTTGQVIWFWQIVLVVPGLLLAAQPLRSTIRQVDAMRLRQVDTVPLPT